MKRLTQTKLFHLLKSAHEIDLSQLDEAYENFAQLLYEECDREKNPVVLYRRLTYTRIEITSFPLNNNNNGKTGEKNSDLYFNHTLQNPFAYRCSL